MSAAAVSHSEEGRMNRTGVLRRAAALGAAMLAATAALASTPRVQVEVRVEREIVRADASGRKVVERKPVDVARPGDVLVYTLQARNVGDGPAVDARLEDPIPQGTVLVIDSLEHGAAVPSASLDGGATWQSFPATVETHGEDGRVERVPAPPESYTHLRWTLPGALGPGEGKDVRFKVRIR